MLRGYYFFVKTRAIWAEIKNNPNPEKELYNELKIFKHHTMALQGYKNFCF